MDESLKLLNVITSGFDDVLSKQRKTDDEIYKEAVKISDLNEKIAFLKANTNGKSPQHLKSKRYLSELIKDIDPEGACAILSAICRDGILLINDCLELAKLLIKTNSWLFAKEVLELAKMICSNMDEASLNIIVSELLLVNEKINKKSPDSSANILKNIKIPTRLSTLEQLCHKSEIKLAAYYAFKLLNNNPADQAVCEITYKALLLVNNKMIFNAFINHLTTSKDLSKEYKDFYLGLTYYQVENFDKSIQRFENLTKTNFKDENVKIFLALNYLLKEDLESFNKTVTQIPVSTNFLNIALNFIYSALLDIKLEEKEFPGEKYISLEISKIISKLLTCKKTKFTKLLISKFKNVGLQKLLPSLYIYLGELFVKENMLIEAKDLLKDCEDIEKHRLYSWIYRLEGKEELAKSELVKYRTESLFNKDMPTSIQCQMINVPLPDLIPKNKAEILDLLKNSYEEVKKTINSIELEYGINNMTCAEANCQDCCKKTFPFVSYTEYLYMRNWLDKQPEDFKAKIQEESINIVNSFKEKYGKEPPFLFGKTIDTEEGYPSDFSFTCPYLGNNQCNVYEARPFTCRAYSYGSSDGKRFKGCNYFLAQFKTATKLNKTRKVINMNSFKDFLGGTDVTLTGKKIAAPIPVWFAYSHKEILKKIEPLIF